MNRIWLLLSGTTITRLKDTLVNPQLATVSGLGTIYLLGSSLVNSPKVRNPAPDTDGGPYCVFNTTTNRLQTSGFVSSGFLVSNQDCRSNCALPGCTQYRLDSYTSFSYTKLNQCVVAEAFHYSLAGAAREQWCDSFDLQRSVFSFRGQTYIDQWYWLGWGTKNDCMNAILCGPTSHYFDSTQLSSLAWCQPVPAGKYSPACSNNVADCAAPPWADDMRLAIWTSHGFGQPDGCGVRLVASALFTCIDVSSINLASPWTISATIGLGSIFPPNTEMILFGSFLTFCISLRVIGPNMIDLSLYHRDLTVSGQVATVSSATIQWFPGEVRMISISLDAAGPYRLLYFIDGVFVSSSSVIPPLLRASIGRFKTTQFTTILGPSTIHVGPVFAQASDFESSTTSAPNPYLNWGTGGSLDFSISNIQISSYTMTTTTSPSPTSSGTVFIPATTSTQIVQSTTRTESTSMTAQETTQTPITVAETSLITATSTTTTTEVMMTSVPETSTTITSLFIAFVVLTTVGIFFYMAYKYWRKRREKMRRASDPFETDMSQPEPEAWYTSDAYHTNQYWTS
jgi:hypothetical protein